MIVCHNDCRRHDLSYDHNGTLATVHKTRINYGNTVIKPVLDKNVEGMCLDRDILCAVRHLCTNSFFSLFAGNPLIYFLIFVYFLTLYCSQSSPVLPAPALVRVQDTDLHTSDKVTST